MVWNFSRKIQSTTHKSSKDEWLSKTLRLGPTSIKLWLALTHQNIRRKEHFKRNETKTSPYRYNWTIGELRTHIGHNIPRPSIQRSNSIKNIVPNSGRTCTGHRLIHNWNRFPSRGTWQAMLGTEKIRNKSTVTGQLQSIMKNMKSWSKKTEGNKELCLISWLRLRKTNKKLTCDYFQ